MPRAATQNRADSEPERDSSANRAAETEPRAVRHLRAEQIRLASENVLALVANAVNACAVAAVVFGSVPTPAVVGWLALILAVSAARYCEYRNFRSVEVPRAEIARWGRRLVAATGITGVLWGVSAVVVVGSDQVLLHAFIAFVIAGMSAGALMVSASYLPAFYAFTLPAVLPLAAAFIAAGDAPHVVMAGMTVLFLILSIAIATRWNGNIRAAILLQRDLAASRRRFRDFAESASDWYFEFDEKLEGATVVDDDEDRDALIQRLLRDLRARPAADADPALGHLRQCVQSRRPFRELVYSYPDAAGGRRWVRLGGKPAFDRDGVYTGFRVVVSDITARKKDEEIREREHQMLETVAAGAPLSELLDGVARWMEEAMTGCRSSILLLDNETTLRHGAAPSLPEAYVEDIDGICIGPDAGACGTAAHFARLVVSEDIETDPKWDEWRAAALTHGLRACWSIPILSGAGTVLGTLAIYWDAPARPSETDRRIMQVAASLAALVIERHRVEESLRQSNRLEAIGQLTAGVAHEFNNLIQAIVAGLDVLRGEMADDSSARQRLESVIASAFQGRELTRSLLSFVGARDVESGVVAVDPALTSAIELLRPTLGENIEIVYDASEGLWPIKVNRGEFEGAILNLALNARDAMTDGGRLRIGASNFTADTEIALGSGNRLAAGDYVLVSVSDDGAGMPAETVARVFDPFFTTKDTGTGLGLSRVYGFVTHQAAGRIEIDSEVGSGTTVRLYLPRATDAAATASAPDGRPPEAVPAVDGRTILLVEDDQIVRTALASLLERMGYGVRSAATAREALEVLDTGTAVDLLLTDIAMSGDMNGVELARRATQVRPSLRTLYMTGYAHDELTRNGVTCSDGQLLHKPFRAEELSEAVAENLSGPVAAG